MRDVTLVMCAKVKVMCELVDDDDDDDEVKECEQRLRYAACTVGPVNKVFPEDSIYSGLIYYMCVCV